MKSLSARELFNAHPEIKDFMDYYANTVGQYGNKDVIRKYIENQGKKNIKNSRRTTQVMELTQNLETCLGVVYFIKSF